MRAITEKLHAAQKDLLRLPLGSPAWRSTVQSLSDSVPSPILAHFLRLVSAGQTGVALVRHGICGGCHIRVCSGLMVALQDPKDLHLCEHCGRYLLLPSEEFMPCKAPAASANASRVAQRAHAMAT